MGVWNGGTLLVAGPKTLKKGIYIHCSLTAKGLSWKKRELIQGKRDFSQRNNYFLRRF